MLLLRNLAYNASSQHQRQQGAAAAAAAEAAGASGGSLQEWSGGEVLPAVRRVLERGSPSPAVRALRYAGCASWGGTRCAPARGQPPPLLCQHPGQLLLLTAPYAASHSHACPMRVPDPRDRPPFCRTHAQRSPPPRSPFSPIFRAETQLFCVLSRASQLKEHALYVVVNMASGSEAQKGAVMAHGWPGVLLGAMGDGEPKVREAAVWAVINLSWR